MPSAIRERAVALCEPVAKGYAKKEGYYIQAKNETFGNIDEGGDWCFECGRAKCRNLRRHNRKAGWVLCGNDGEEDGPRWCDGCGARLDYTFTEYAAEVELLEVFPNNPFRPDDAEACDAIILIDQALDDEGELASAFEDLCRKVVAAFDRAEAAK